jgi:hypothetical protein
MIGVPFLGLSLTYSLWFVTQKIFNNQYRTNALGYRIHFWVLFLFVLSSINISCFSAQLHFDRPSSGSAVYVAVSSRR